MIPPNLKAGAPVCVLKTGATGESWNKLNEEPPRHEPVEENTWTICEPFRLTVPGYGIEEGTLCVYVLGCRLFECSHVERRDGVFIPPTPAWGPFYAKPSAARKIESFARKIRSFVTRGKDEDQ